MLSALVLAPLLLGPRAANAADAPADPKPIQSRLPILVGTAGPRMLRLTARYADEWNSWGHIETATWKRAAFVEACEAEGRDPASMRTSVQALIVITEDADVIERAGSGGFADRTLAGSVDQIVEDMQARRERYGFSYFVVSDRDLATAATVVARLVDT